MPALPFTPRSWSRPHWRATSRTTLAERWDVEVVADDAPAGRAGCACKQVLKEAGEVRFGAAVADRAMNPPGRDVKAGDQRLRAVAAVLELLPLDLARPHRQGRGDLLQR